MSFFQKRFTYFISFLVLYACDTEQEPAPAYLTVQDFSFQAKPGEGTSRQNITDAWIYVNNQYVGAYELPATIPVLSSGLLEVLIQAGFRKNGRITSPSRYELLEPYQTTALFDPLETTQLAPSTAYQANLDFTFLEEFEGVHFLNIDRDGNSETKILLSTVEDAFEGLRSGVIELTKDRKSLLAVYDIEKVIPQSPDPIILELHFKADIPFSIGFLGNKGALGEDYLINASLLPKKEWTKAYFDFRDIINDSNANGYRLAISANFQEDTAIAIQRILLDNIKVVHR
ncbi:MAG: hypothetical protein IPM92_04965 [Saprospiraceae bacterium]|nr:hypothetical protein [Saprospiraceae bacterium]